MKCPLIGRLITPDIHNIKVKKELITLGVIVKRSKSQITARGYTQDPVGVIQIIHPYHKDCFLLVSE